MAEKPSHDSSTDDEAPSDTIELEQQPIMDTAEFKALVELDSELLPDGEGTAEAPADDDDLLTITDQLERLRLVDEDEDDFGLDPYDCDLK